MLLTLCEAQENCPETARWGHFLIKLTNYKIGPFVDQMQSPKSKPRPPNFA